MKIEIELSQRGSRWLRWALAIIVVLALCVAGLVITGNRGARVLQGETLPKNKDKFVHGTVTDVVDGDTIKFRDVNLGVLTLRLHGIDAPERGQPFGQEATEFNRSSILGKEVAIFVHSRDKYGRFVVVLLYDGGRILNEDLIRSGWAWWYRRYAPANLRYRELEAQARAERVGLWCDGNATAPWIWRARSGDREEDKFNDP